MVTSPPLAWPTTFLVMVLFIAAVATILPWILPRAHRTLAALFIAAIATLVWVSYEQHLRSIALPGDPLIRVDLLLIIPLVALDWLSALLCIITQQMRRAG